MSVAKLVEKHISSIPFLEESIQEDLINISSLARKLKPAIEEELDKSVKIGAVVMAINRLNFKKLKKVNNEVSDFLSRVGDIIIRSNLSTYTFKNSMTLSAAQMKLMDIVSNEIDGFCTVSQGVYETTVVTVSTLDDQVNKIFEKESVIENQSDLSSVTLRLPTNDVPGVYYYILKHVAWENINISEVISTRNELTLVVSDDEIDRLFTVLMQLKKRK